MISGQDLQSNQYNDEGNGILYITGASCIENEKLKKNRWTEYPKSISIKNDILISCKGSIGAIAINTEDKVHIARQIMAIRTNSYCNNLFIKILVKNIIPTIQSKSKGVIPGIERKDILDSLVAIPSLSEQKRIAETVEALLELVDLIDSDKVDLTNLIKQTKSKVLDLAIKGKLVSQDPNDEPADKLLEKIREEKEQLIKKGKLKRDKNETFIYKNSDDNSYYEQIDGETVCIDDDLPFKIPNSWRWCRLSAICCLVNGEKVNDRKLILLNVKYLRTKNNKKYLTSGIILNSGDFVILVDGENSGEVFKILETGFMGSTFKKLFISEKFCNEYLLYLLKFYKKLFRDNKTGSAIPHLNKDLFKNLLIGIPPLNEQQRIAIKIENIFSYLDNLESIIKGS